jgi:hypothetical protein
VFILYAVLAGLIAGRLAGGRLGRLAELRIRWLPLALTGLGVQVVLFSDPGTALAGDLAVVLVNIRLPGLALVAVGAGLNLVAILANGGSMPADPEALASLGKPVEDAANSIVAADPALWFLTDLFAMPTWLPLANVFSIGDVLIGVGIAVAVAAGMRSPADRGASAGGAGPEAT